MNLALPAFGQKTVVGRNLHVSGRGFFALSPPMGYKNLMCEAQRLRRRSFSYHPPCPTNLPWFGLNPCGSLENVGQRWLGSSPTKLVQKNTPPTSWLVTKNPVPCAERPKKQLSRPGAADGALRSHLLPHACPGPGRRSRALLQLVRVQPADALENGAGNSRSPRRTSPATAAAPANNPKRSRSNVRHGRAR